MLKLVRRKPKAKRKRQPFWIDTGDPIHGVLAIDYETDGLAPERGCKPFLVGCQDERGNVRMWELGGPGPNGSYDWNGPRHPLLVDGPSDAVRAAIGDPGLTKLAHNAKFELRMSRALGWEPCGTWLDTMQMAPLDNEYQKIGLKPLAENNLGLKHPEHNKIIEWVDAEDARRRAKRRKLLRAQHGSLDAKQINELLKLRPPKPTTFLDFYNASRKNKFIMIRYLERDLDDALRLKWFYQKPMQRLYKGPHRVETRLVKHVARMEDNGIRIDVPYIESRIAHHQPKLEEMTDTLCTLAKGAINLNSHVQIKAVLASRGLHLSTTRKDFLEKYRTRDEFVSALLDFRELSKVVNTFFYGLLTRHVNGFIHASFWQNGREDGNAIRTGRFSSSNPNLQNIPKRTAIGKEVRRAFIPRDGFKFASPDFRQIEPRLLAHYARDPRLIAQFLAGIDPYIAIGSILFGETITKEDPRRDVAKIITLAIMYGMGVDKMARNLAIAVDTARGMKARYFRRLPQVQSLMRACQTELARYGYVEDVYGRRYHVPRHLGYKSINAKIQGTAAGAMKRAMCRVGDLIERRYRTTLEMKLLSQIHDELIIEIPDCREGRLAMVECAEVMQDRETFSVPLLVSAELGWADKEPLPEWQERLAA